MKRSLPLSALESRTREFFIRWRFKKSYPQSEIVDITDCLEVLLATSAHFKDTSFTGSLTFDNIVDLQELKIGFDGDEPLDMMLYYIERFINERLKKIIIV